MVHRQVKFIHLPSSDTHHFDTTCFRSKPESQRWIAFINLFTKGEVGKDRLDTYVKAPTDDLLSLFLSNKTKIKGAYRQFPICVRLSLTFLLRLVVKNVDFNEKKMRK